MDDPASYSLAILFDGAEHSFSLATVLGKLLAVLFFVGANGFFVGAEFALVSVRRTRLETRAAAGSARAQCALRLINDPTFFIHRDSQDCQFFFAVFLVQFLQSWTVGAARRTPCGKEIQKYGLTSETLQGNWFAAHVKNGEGPRRFVINTGPADRFQSFSWTFADQHLALADPRSGISFCIQQHR